MLNFEQIERLTTYIDTYRNTPYTDWTEYKSNQDIADLIETIYEELLELDQK